MTTRIEAARRLRARGVTEEELQQLPGFIPALVAHIYSPHRNEAFYPSEIDIMVHDVYAKKDAKSKRVPGAPLPRRRR